MAVSESISPGMIDPAIFEQLQANIDSDAQVREELRNILQRLERQGIIFYLPRLTEGDFSSIAGRTTQSLLSRAHSVPAAERMQQQLFFNCHGADPRYQFMKP